MIKRSLCAIALLMSGAAVHAAELNYTYLDAGYTYHNVDTSAGFGSSYGHGLTVRASAGFAENFYFSGSANATKLGNDDRLRSFSFGPGARYTVAENIDLTGLVGYTVARFDQDGTDTKATVNGIVGNVGVRALVIDRLEVNPSVSLARLNGDNDWSIALDVRGQVLRNLTAGVSVATDEKADNWVYGLTMRMQARR